MKNLIYLFLISPQLLFSQSIIVSGYIKEKNSQESIPNVSIQTNTNSGTSANNYGYYSLKISQNQSITLKFSAIGYKIIEQKVLSSKNIELNIELSPENQELQEVVVKAETQQISKNQMSVIKIPIQIIKQIPTLFGEKDVIKALQLLPGVQKGNEGLTALYVRGGGPDQNLIILDEAQVYNANHLFGFFSVFNGDAIKNVDFWKGGFPARYGGRLSSVIDMQLKDGSREKLHGEGGIGLIPSRLTLEGPIKKNKSSFLVSTRRSYIDLLTKPFMSANSKTAYRFYDFNAKLNYDLNKKNKLYLSSYFGDDKLSIIELRQSQLSTLSSTTGMGWGNATATLRWNHLFNEKLFSNTTFLVSNFNFKLFDDFVRTRNDQTTSTYAQYTSAIRDYSLKIDFDYFYSNQHAIKTGFLLTNHAFQPKAFITENRIDKIINQNHQTFDNQEFAVYAEDSYKIQKLSTNIGIRFNGLKTTDKIYFFAEPRLTFSYDIFNDITLKGSYSRNNQFVHLLSNTGTGLSTDLWVPATSKIPPQQADQFVIGVSKNFPKQNITLTIESYRKYLRNIVAYQEGATFLVLNDGAKEVSWEDNVAIGKGESYGTEVLIQKNVGKLTGWIGYTLSWTIHQFADLNEGKKFYPRYDRRHDISIVGIYKFSPKILLSANWVYGTGNALTVPQAYYFTNNSFNENQSFFGTSRVDYLGSRNSFRADPFHRLDVAVQFHKQKKRFVRFWEFGLYNAYSRKNPFYYYLKTTNDYVEKGQRIELVKKSLFPILPSISYNFKF